jgi:diphosphomevalonate decarboxylase
MIKVETNDQATLREQAAGSRRATALAHPNIAFVKYWGNQSNALRLPANPSLSMNLGDLQTVTAVTFDDGLSADALILNSEPVVGEALERVTTFLDLIRVQAGIKSPARVESTSNFPVSAGIASSAAAFAALSVAGAAAAGLTLDEAALSRLARRGSGSASRSVPSGYCQWCTGTDETSFATSIAPPEYWDLRDVIAIVADQPKAIGSTGGHPLASTSPLQPARLEITPEHLKICRKAVLARDLLTLGPIIEHETIMMHAVMMTSRVPLYYWNAATITLLHAAHQWRLEGLAAYFTIDAGPNVHFICEAGQAEDVAAKARQVAGVREVLVSRPGGPAHLLPPS